MKSILTVGLMLLGSAAFSQEIPNVWKYRGQDSIRFSIPLMKNKPFNYGIPYYDKDEPFIIIPKNPKNSLTFRMPVVVPTYETVGLIPNPALDPMYQRSVMGRK